MALFFFCLFFLQETRSTIENGRHWCDNFKGKIFSSHGTTSSCDVAIAFLGSKSLEVVEAKIDDQDGILILYI